MATINEYSATPRQYFSLEKDDYVTQVIPSGSSPTGWTNLRGQPVDIKGGTIDGMPAEEFGRMTVAPNTTSSQTNVASQTPQLTSSNSKITNLNWLNATSGATVPVSIGGKNYIYFPESYYSEGLTIGRGAVDPYSGKEIAGKYVYSPAFLQEGIESKFIPVTLGQDLVSELKKLQSSDDVFYGDDPDKKIQNYLNATAINIDKAKNFDKGYLIPAEDFQSAMKKTSIAESITGQGPAPFAQQDLGVLSEPPSGLMLRNGQKTYASGSGKTFTDVGGQFYNYTPGSSGGGLLDDLGLGGITDVIQELGPIGQIALAYATGGLSIPEQLAAQTLYNAAGGATFEDALKGAALNVALTQGVKESGLFGGGTQSNLTTGVDGELIPFDEGLTGIDVGDVIPATAEQLKGLYGTGGVFNPPADTTGIDMGDVIPATPAQLEGLYNTGGVFGQPDASTGGGELGENVPSGIDKWDEAFIRAGGIFNPEYVNASTGGMELGEGVPSGVAAWDKAYIDAGGTFLPGTTTDVVADYFNPDSTLTTPVTLPSLKDLANLAVVAGTVNSLVNPPSLGGGPSTGGGGFNIVPVPSDWKSPTYNQQFTPLDLNSLFTTANLLKGTQWENLPPEIQFAPTMEALTNMISNGQTSTSN